MSSDRLSQPHTETHSTEYEDNWLDRLFIALFSRKMARATGASTLLNGYDGFVDLSQRIARDRSPQDQQEAIGRVLRSLVPDPILWTIRTLFSPTPKICEWNAWFATQLFEWLVGPCEVMTTEVTGVDGRSRLQASGVRIHKCRYLEQSGCVGACVNLCKAPTQEFFTRDFGIPVTMTPNFDDFSCEMVFGQVPPPPPADPAYGQPCTETCPAAIAAASSCPSVRSRA